MTTPDLASIAADPGRIDAVPRSELPALIGEAEALRARLWTRLQTPPDPAPPARPKSEPDRLLPVREAAERLGVSPRWIYRHADSLPFARRLTSGTLRFSERGLIQWQEARR